MAYPSIAAQGTYVTANAASLTVTLPTHSTGQCLLIFVSSSTDTDTLACSTTGWSQTANSPRSLRSGTAANSIKIAAFSKIAASGSETSPVVTGATNLILGIAFAVTGSHATTPIHITSGGSASTASVVVPGATTSAAECFVFIAVATTRDITATTTFSAWANTDLANVTEVLDQTVITGAGGGLGVATGQKATAAAYGNTTVTSAATGSELDHAYMTVAIAPAVSLPYSPDPLRAMIGR